MDTPTAATLAASAPLPAEAVDLSVAFTWLGIVVMVLAQLSAPWVLRLYRRRLRNFMMAPAAPPPASATAPLQGRALLQAIERQRRRVLGVLLGVLTLYSAMAATAFFYRFDSGSDGLLSWGISFFMFAAFCGPVVLLGVSAARFGRLFWVYFAPATFAAFAMQAIVTSLGGSGGRQASLLALGGVVLLTAAAVLLRAWAPAAWGRRLQAMAVLWGWKFKLPAVLVVLGSLLVALNVVQHPVLLKLLSSCFIALVAIGLCFLTMVDRIKRTLVPLLGAALLTIFVVALGAGALAWDLLQPGDTLARSFIIGCALGLGALAAFFMLSWIGLAYAQKLFSDAQFQVFSWMLAVSGVAMAIETMFQGASLIDPSNLQLAGASALALLVYWLVTRYGLQPLASNRRLLVLRVFAQDSRGERLMDELEYRWRFIGPIVLIGGTDMAAHTIDPAKAAAFLRGRLRDSFIADSTTLRRRISTLDDQPDPDGRYRVNEYFCFADMWQEAVQRLLQGCDAVVVDLRGFNTERRGTAWELAQLRDTGALARTVFLVDGQTDHAAVHGTLGTQPGQPLPAAHVMAVDRGMNGGALVEALVSCLSTVRPASPAAVPLRSAA